MHSQRSVGNKVYARHRTAWAHVGGRHPMALIDRILAVSKSEPDDLSFLGTQRQNTAKAALVP
jgi:hypothetical protein